MISAAVPSSVQDPKIAVAAAVNDKAVLDFCLLRSPDLLDGAASLETYEGFKSAASAYNAALREATADYVLLVHQDVYLPRGSIARLTKTLEQLSAADPDWAVAGVIGVDDQGHVQGRTWSSGIGALVGNPLQEPVRAEALDELLLVVRRDAGLSFDEQLPGFHLYGADIVQIAKAQGRTSYAMDLLAIHHSRPVLGLGKDYKAAYRYLQAKWRDRLPIPNLICPITSNASALAWRDFRIRLANRFRTERTDPRGDPAEIAERLLSADGRQA